MRRSNLKGQRVAWGRMVYASLAPFFAAALLGSLLFRASRGPGSTRGEAVVQRHPVRQVLEEALPCAGGNCELQGGLVARGDGSPGASQPTPDGAVVAAAASSVAPGDLPKLFLFVGILSGRGYRHRRLAVREAWSNRAQVPGTVVSKFILSEDERTPQVRAARGRCLQARRGRAPGCCLTCFEMLLSTVQRRCPRQRSAAASRMHACGTRAYVGADVCVAFVPHSPTVQVEKELEAYGDIVFVREKTNYKSILFKTYYVRGGGPGAEVKTVCWQGWEREGAAAPGCLPMRVWLAGA